MIFQIVLIDFTIIFKLYVNIYDIVVVILFVARAPFKPAMWLNIYFLHSLKLI
jgi:hypothetical protein